MVQYYWFIVRNPEIQYEKQTLAADFLSTCGHFHKKSFPLYRIKCDRLSKQNLTIASYPVHMHVHKLDMHPASFTSAIWAQQCHVIGKWDNNTCI